MQEDDVVSLNLSTDQLLRHPILAEDRPFYVAPVLFVLDVAIAILVLPVFLVVCLVVALDVGGPLIVWSRTVDTRNGRTAATTFRLRTVRASRDQLGNIIPDCDRRSTVGRILEASMLDRLPQLLNQPVTRYFSK